MGEPVCAWNGMNCLTDAWTPGNEVSARANAGAGGPHWNTSRTAAGATVRGGYAGWWLVRIRGRLPAPGHV